MNKRQGIGLLLSVVFAGCASKVPPKTPPIAEPVPVASSSAPQPAAVRADTPDADFRKVPPEIGKRRQGKPPAVTEGKLQNGAKVLVVELRDVPTVSFQLVLAWPNDTQPMTTTRLTEELRTRSSEGEELHARIERISGSTPHFELNRDALHIATNTTPEVLPRVFKTLADSLRPIDPKQHHGAVAGILGGLGFSAQASVEDLAFDKLLAPHSPYRNRTNAPASGPGKPPTPGALNALLAEVATGAHVTFVAVGDTSLSELVPKLETAFGSLPAGKASPQVDNKLVHGKFALLNDRALTTASFALVAEGPARSHKDYPAIQLASHILGERLTSTFGMGAGSKLEASKLTGLWIMSGTANGAGFSSAVSRMQDTLAGLDSITTEQLDKAKRPWIEWTETMLERKTDIAWSVARASIQGLSLDEMASLHAAFGAVTTADVARVARERLDKKVVSLAAVGAQDKLKGLDKLGFGAPMVTQKPNAVMDKVTGPTKVDGVR